MNKEKMTKLSIADADRKGIATTTIRFHPLISWFYFLNFVSVAIFCLALLKIYKMLRPLYKWFFSSKEVPKQPVILVISPKNAITQEIVRQLSETFHSEVTIYKDFNFNIPEPPEPQKYKKSQLIYNQTSIRSQEKILKLKTFIQNTFGFVDILVVSQNEDPERGSSTHDFLKNLNKELLAQYWTVMAFLPEMLRRNKGYILSFALGRSSLINTGIMRSIYEELLQRDTKVKLTLVESNSALDKCFIPSLSSSLLASLIVRSMWDSSSVVKVPSLTNYLIIVPELLVRLFLSLVTKIKNMTFIKKFLK